MFPDPAHLISGIDRTALAPLLVGYGGGPVAEGRHPFSALLLLINVPLARFTGTDGVLP